MEAALTIAIDLGLTALYAFSAVAGCVTAIVLTRWALAFIKQFIAQMDAARAEAKRKALAERSEQAALKLIIEEQEIQAEEMRRASSEAAQMAALRTRADTFERRYQVVRRDLEDRHKTCKKLREAVHILEHSLAYHRGHMATVVQKIGSSLEVEMPDVVIPPPPKLPRILDLITIDEGDSQSKTLKDVIQRQNEAIHEMRVNIGELTSDRNYWRQRSLSGSESHQGDSIGGIECGQWEPHGERHYATTESKGAMTDSASQLSSDTQRATSQARLKEPEDQEVTADHTLDQNKPLPVNADEVAMFVDENKAQIRPTPDTEPARSEFMKPIPASEPMLAPPAAPILGGSYERKDSQPGFFKEPSQEAPSRDYEANEDSDPDACLSGISHDPNDYADLDMRGDATFD